MDELINRALLAREKAYAPYSKFKVGAAVLGTSGRIYSGCNIENASYGLSNCAERTAIFNAIAEGETGIAAIAVAADTPEPVSPCGACRQVMAEFHIEKIILVNLQGHQRIYTIEDLLPYSFNKSDFEKRR